MYRKIVLKHYLKSTFNIMPSVITLGGPVNIYTSGIAKKDIKQPVMKYTSKRAF